MSFTQWTHRHTRSILFVIVVLALGGIFSAFALPVSLFPRVSFPRIEVNINAGERPASRMAVAVTYPVERTLREIPGVESVRSTTSRGSAEIYINFGWGTKMARALLQVQGQINGILPKLPSDTTFRAKRMDLTNFPVLGYSLTSKTVSQVALRDMAEYKIRPLLSTIRGVSRVQVQGGAIREYRVVVDPQRIQALGLTLSDVARALAASNILSSVGKIQDHDRLYLIVSDSRFTSLKEISRVVLRTGDNGVVRLSDVATVEPNIRPQWVRATADGHRAVLLQVFQQPGGNTVRISRQIKQALRSYRKNLPPGVHIATWYNQSQLILEAADSVRDAVCVGILLAVVVLLVFLRNWKMTLIAAVMVPAVLASTILLLHLLHMSFNVMTLGGMAAAVGLIIDDAIVMVEHIVRRIESGSADHHRSIIEATREFTRPLAGSSASTIIIFTPLAFLSGITGAFFKALSLTMAAALFISFFTAWLGVPVLAARMLGSNDLHHGTGGGFTRLAHRLYETIMRPMLRAPVLVLVVILPILAAGYFAYTYVGTGFMPHMDEGGFILNYVAPPGTSLTQTNHMLVEVEKILLSNPYVDTYSRRTGLQLGGGLTEPYTGDFFIRLKPFPRPPIEEIMSNVRREVHEKVPGLKIDTDQMMQDLIGDLTAVPEPIEIKIYSNHPSVLDATARRVAAAIKTVCGVVEVRSGIVLSGDAIEIHVNPVKAALQGLTAGDVTRLVREYLTGKVSTYIQHGPRLVGVRVWVPRDFRHTVGEIRNIELRSPDGHLVPLKMVATLKIQTGQQEIMRDNLKRMVAVKARINGRDMGSAVAAVEKVLQQPGMIPTGVYYHLGGLYRQQQIAFKGLLVVMIAAVILVFLLLLFMYEHFRVAAAMLSIPLLALACVCIGLFVTHTELNVSSMMGMTMVVGIVTEVAIFYYSEFHDMPADSSLTTRFIRAGQNRMRPIAMTTLAAILALMPLALGIGQGSQMQQPLAIAIISGLVVQLPLTLVVLPNLLAIVHRARVGEEVIK